MIPSDAHAFVKVFSSSDMQNYTPYSYEVISICNLTDGMGSSKEATEPPLMRIASGSWPGWAASATRQCQWGSGALPSSVEDKIVRIKVCEKVRKKPIAKATSTSTALTQIPRLQKSPPDYCRNIGKAISRFGSG